MTRVVVLIPYRGDSGWRDRAFRHVNAQVRKLGMPVYIDDSGDQPFSIARTWNKLAKEAGNWDIALRWAADALIENLDSIREGIRVVEHRTMPFDKRLKLGKQETRDYYNQRVLPKRDDPVPYGGITVLTREVWDTVGGYDPRFVGYGAEDYAFDHGVGLHFGERTRIPGRMISLWHPAARGSKAALSTNPYWLKRQANLDLWRNEIKPISTPDQWSEYLQRRGS